MTPDELADTLGLGPHSCVWVGGNDRAARRLVEQAIAERSVNRCAADPVDVAIITARDVEEARYFLKKFKGRLAERASVWIITQAHPEVGDAPDPHWSRLSCAGGAGDWKLTQTGQADGGLVVIRVEGGLTND